MNELLLVEDDTQQRELYQMKFQHEGYCIDAASNGKQAIEMVKRKKYDLVITDIQMPGMNGIEVLGKIISINKRIPVIIHSAHHQYKSNFLTWIADAYVLKSSDLDTLVETVKKLLEYQVNNMNGQVQ